MRIRTAVRIVLAICVCLTAGGAAGQSVESVISAGEPAPARSGNQAVAAPADPLASVPPSIDRRFIDKGDGTVLDKETELVWTKTANPMKTRIHLQAAKDHIADMNTGKKENFGYRDWRLPSVAELKSLIDADRYFPALPDGHVFENVQNEFYWTSSGGQSVIGYSWMVDAGSGEVKHDYVSYCNFLYLWPVRGQAKRLPEEKLSPAKLDLSLGGLACDEGVKTLALPSALTVTATSPSEIALSWKYDESGGEVAWFNIYDDKAFVKSVPTRSTTFAGLQPGSEICYSVSAFNSGGVESKQTGKVCAKTWTSAATGTVWSMGFNQYGQLGSGSTEALTSLARIRDLSDVVKISAGVEHAVAVKSDGTVWTWGRNERGQLGDGTLDNRTLPVQVKGLYDVVDVAAGWYHSLALKSDGTVWAWGRNYYGQLGTGTRADSLTPIRVAGIATAKSIAAGWYHSLAVLQDGTVAAWGWNLKGQLGLEGESTVVVPSAVVGLKDITSAAAGMYHSLALSAPGKVYAWGWNEYGQLGNGTKLDSPVPTIVKDLQSIRDISGGMHHSVALAKDGKAYAWGRNVYGQLGIQGASLSPSPVAVVGMDNVVDVAAGAYHSLAVRQDGSLWLWGWDYSRNLKNSPPTRVGAFTDVKGAFGGLHFTNLIKKN